MPLDPDDPTVLVVDRFADYRTPVPGRLVGGGETRSTGLEGLIRKKLAGDVYGLLSYGYTVSRYNDLTGNERNRTFDSRHVVAVVRVVQQLDSDHEQRCANDAGEELVIHLVVQVAAEEDPDRA